MRTAWRLLTRTVSDWYADRAQRTGAAVAYYTIFTLAPGLVIVMAVGGFLIGPAGEASIIAQFRDLLGERGAQAIEAMVRSARTGTPGATGLALALGTLIFGLWGVFGELQEGLNTIWRVPPRPARRIRDYVKERFWSFLVLVGTGFLLLLSLLLTAWLTVVGTYVSHLFPGSALALEAVHGLLSAMVLTLAFALIFKVLPDVELAWQDVLVGATVTALLFIVGTFLIGLYLVNWAVGSAYGAAGSLVVIVVWVYYSAQIFLLGAEFTKVWTTHVEKVVRPLTARPGEGLGDAELVTTAFTPDPPVFEPVAMPPAWPARPWIYGNVITSRNGIVTWARVGPHDDPIRAIAGGDFTRPARRADMRLMRRLRAAADAVSFGAQTLRDQPDLIGGVADAGGDLGATLVRHRAGRGQEPVPLQVVYTESGGLDLSVRLFNTSGVVVVIVTTEEGARVLRARGSEALGIRLIIGGATRVEAPGLVDAHERLFAEVGVRHLVCEGGALVLDALHEARILDELFVTVSDVDIDPGAHAAVRRLAALDAGAGRLVVEGRSAADAGYRFQRWRFNDP